LKQTVKLEELVCPICNEGVLNNKLCPLCLGHGVLFRLSGTFGYVSGSTLYIEYQQKAS